MSRGAIVAVLTVLAALFTRAPAAHAQTRTLYLWHAYGGEELAALDRVLRMAEARMGIRVQTLAVPFDAYDSKLTSAIPHGHGPDVFIDAHNRLVGYAARGLIAPVASAAQAARDDGLYESVAVRALTNDGSVWAVPLTIKCLALYVNTDLVTEVPTTLEQIEALRGHLAPGVWPLVYYADNAYFHAPLAHAYGAQLLDPSTGRYAFWGPAAERSVARAITLIHEHAVPDETDGALVQQLFANGRAATAISGPWLAAVLPAREHYVVAPLPYVDSAAAPMRSFVTVEGAFVSARSEHPADALALARFLASPEASVVRGVEGREVVATTAAWSDPRLGSNRFLATFRETARDGVIMPTHPFMHTAFEPAQGALRKALRGDASVHDALLEGRHRFEDVTRPLPARRSPATLLVVLGALALFACFRAVQRARDPVFRAEFARSRPAYRYVFHAVVVLVALVIVPLVIGAVTSLYAGRDGALYYVGSANYIDILTARGGPLFATGSFYLVLCVTVLWAVANITLHLAIGVALALLLSRPALRLKGFYRVVLIIPWAVPSYVTALAWRGMFHRQMGAINAILAAVGVDPVNWFARFSTAFGACVATNVWLGFPFMMVVTLGALAAIPRDLYEAAAVDGATAWQRFWRITLPLLRPSLAPAVAMGAVWTFNMFNVIYLVSGGEPDGQTEILVTEAYRWAFTRQAQYGYAAAYAVLIFFVLAFGTRALDRAAARVAGEGPR